MNKKKLFVLVCLSAVLSACDFIAIQSAPKKQPAARSELALQADKLFWKTLHNGEYQNIPRALEAVTAAYLDNPSDAVTAAHVGWLHTWRIVERARLPAVSPTVTDDAVLARKYFQEAVALDPAEARYLGFLGSALLTEGSIHRDEKLIRQGYFTLRDSIKAWPEFNLFTAGYVMSRRAADSKQFREGLEWQWQNIDECVGEKVDRRMPDMSKYLSRATTQGAKRVCWNSWIAPHNFEGFFLNFGDMLVKAGDWETAQKMYANARLSPDYRNWKYRGVLEERIRKAQANVASFNEPERRGGNVKNPIMVNSAFACMGCHQK